MSALTVAGSTFAAFALEAKADAADPREIRLVDQSGAAFRLRDLAGNPAVVTFVASRCSDACPIADAVFSRLAVRLRREGIAARLVTVTLDPTYDTPFVMNRVARRFGAARAACAAWRFASGNPNEVRRLMRSFGVVSETGRRGIPDARTSLVYLLNRDVRLERTMLLSTGTADDVLAVLKTRRRRSFNLPPKRPILSNNDGAADGGTLGTEYRRP